MLNGDGLGPVPACYAAGLTFYEWFWGQTREPVTRACWEWQGATRSQNGYGWVYVPGEGPEFAHRVAWSLSRGVAAPKKQSGFYVLHHCDNPLCCRPTHLYLGTQAENGDDRRHKGKSVSARRRHRHSERRRATRTA